MHRRSRSSIASIAVTAFVMGLSLALPAAANATANPDVYALPGDPGDPGGSKYEGIGLDERRNLFYVSETTGGEISRGRVGDPQAAAVARRRRQGRSLHRARDRCRHRRPGLHRRRSNSTDHPGAPDLWVYSRDGELLAALNAGATGAVFNDVTVARDGAAYFTDSSLKPRIFRVVERNGTWSVELWLDASDTIQTSGPFNLNGIVGTSDGRGLIVVQSTGALWRIDLRSKNVVPVALDGLTGADLVGGDGIVLRGKKLYVVRNFQHVLVELRMTDQFTGASFVTSVATDPARVFTTAKYAHGRLLAVDSKFDEPVAAPPYQVVALRLP